MPWANDFVRVVHSFSLGTNPQPKGKLIDSRKNDPSELAYDNEKLEDTK